MNAIAHAVEALYAPDMSPVIALMAQESVRCLASALPDVVAEPRALAPRSEALRGAWLAGASLGNTTMSLHHKLCHALGGLFDLPHAATHAVVLPHVAAFNLPAAPAAEAALARALSPVDPAGAPADPARALFDLGRALGIPASLAALGLGGSDLGASADADIGKPYANPRPVTRDDLIGILERAFRGDTPAKPVASRVERPGPPICRLTLT
jgi:maleylacetate reductase